MRVLVRLQDKFRYGPKRGTRWRWRHDPRLKFPKPAKVINGVEYYWDDELDAWQPPLKQPRAAAEAEAAAALAHEAEADDAEPAEAASNANV